MSRIISISLDEPNRKLDNISELPHILLVLDQLPKILGGGERIALKIAELLPEYGYRASILTFASHPECAAIKSPPCPIYLLPLQCTYNINSFLSALDLRSFLCEQNIQLVQTFFESSDLWAGFITKAISSAKLIWSRRDMGILRASKHRFAYRIMAGMPDAVFAVSEQVRRYSIDEDGIDPERVQTIYNGIDLSDWDTIYRPCQTQGKKIVTSVGNIRRVKGYDVLIHAAASVVAQFPDVSFSIAGDVLEPDYFMELQAIIQNFNLTDHIHFLGGVTDLKQHLREADIFVLPSRSEGFSNAIVEAMAASLPVIATNVGGNSEAVKDEITGLLVPPNEPTSLATAIIRLLINPEQAAAMGNAGNLLAAELFTSEAMMTCIASTYNKLLTVI